MTQNFKPDAPELTNERITDLVNQHKLAIAAEVRSLGDCMTIAGWLLYSYCLDLQSKAGTTPQVTFRNILQSLLNKSRDRRVKIELVKMH